MHPDHFADRRSGGGLKDHGSEGPQESSAVGAPDHRGARPQSGGADHLSRMAGVDRQGKTSSAMRAAARRTSTREAPRLEIVAAATVTAYRSGVADAASRCR